MSFWRLRRLVVDAPQLRKQDCGRPLALADWPSAHAQHPVQDQRQKAYQRVRPNASRKPVVRRADLDLTLERPKTPLDVGQALLTLHHRVTVSGCTREIGRQTSALRSSGAADPRSARHRAV